MSLQHMVNAWLFLNEDEPSGTNYKDKTSCYQNLINTGVYKKLDVLFLCFGDIVSQGAGWTTIVGDADHPGGYSNADYVGFIVEDARAANPDIKIVLTLQYGSGTMISQIFADPDNPTQAEADSYAANTVAYLKQQKLSGIDFDWEWPLSTQSTTAQTTKLFNALGSALHKAGMILTISPATDAHISSAAVNANMDFINFQLYYSDSLPEIFTEDGFDSALYAYGAKFEPGGPVTSADAPGVQSAADAIADNKANFEFPVYTVWRLNSQNYLYEQAQTVALAETAFSDKK